MDYINWTSAAGLARALFVNRNTWSSCLGVVARLWLGLLFTVPLALGLAEFVIGLLNRHEPAGCTSNLPVWLIVDGSAALLMALLTLVDLARVASFTGTEEVRLAKGPRAADTVDERARIINGASYACMAFTIVFVIPLFRVVWLLYAIDLVYRMDPLAFASLALPQVPRIGSCSILVYSFVFYYLEAVLFVACLLFVGGAFFLAYYAYEKFCSKSKAPHVPSILSGVGLGGSPKEATPFLAGSGQGAGVGGGVKTA